MEDIIIQVESLQIFNHFWLTLFLLVPLVLIARTTVAGTRYSPILIVVVFGLAMGHILVASGVSTPGLPDFQIVDMISRTTIIPLIASFFVGGQELRKLVSKIDINTQEMEIPSLEEISVGTNRSQLIHIVRTFFLLIGVETAYRVAVGIQGGDLTQYYALLAYTGIVCSLVLLDYKATVKNKRMYIGKGVLETFALILVLIATYHISSLIKPYIALPQIFFSMLITAGLGAVFYKWHIGPTLKSLLFAGLPIVLAGNFMIGGSRIAEVTSISGMNSVLAFGFFGQIMWMFGGIALMMIFADTYKVRNLAPGLAGGLSHAGLTGACTAGDLGREAANRTPIMINLPFTAHVFVFSILAVSAERGTLMLIPSLIVFAVGVVLTAMSLRTLKTADEVDGKEIKGLMQFSLGWQLVAIFGSFIILSVFGMQLNHVALATSSSISHFGLLAAIQGEMFGAEGAMLIPFIFAMPFLVHPFVFFLFGKAMARDGRMPHIPVYVLVAVGVAGVIYSLTAI